MKVVVTDCDFSDLTIERQVLGPEVEVIVAASGNADDVAEAAADADGLLVQYAMIGEELFSRLPNLRAVVRYGIGLDNIDLAAADKHQVEVRNVPDYCLGEVAEHALAMIMQVSRRLVAFSRAAASGWDASAVPVPKRVGDQVVGIVGMGRIGTRLAELAAAIGFTVLYHDPYASDIPSWGTGIPLHELAERADHISLHMPLNDTTRHIVDRGVLEMLGPTGHLINTGRGQLIDESALLDALNDGALGWASLDVLQSEPPKGTSALIASHPRVLLTPHIAYLSESSLAALPRRAAETMKELLTQPSVQ